MELISPTINTPKTVIFDFDDTICNYSYDSTPRVYDLFRSILKGKVSATKIKSAFSNPGYATAIRKLFPACQQKAILDRVVEITLEQIETGSRPALGLSEVFSELFAEYRLALFSARDQVSLDQAVENLGIAEYFCAVEGHNGTYPPKPDASGFLAFLDTIGVPSNMVIYVGDTEYDLEMADRANVQFVGAGWFCDHLSATKCEYFCDDFAMLKQKLAEL